MFSGKHYVDKLYLIDKTVFANKNGKVEWNFNELIRQGWIVIWYWIVEKSIATIFKKKGGWRMKIKSK